MSREDPIFGIDVSGHQPADMNFSAAKAEGYEFCVVKATQGPHPNGKASANPYYAAQLGNAMTSGMVVGAYHYLVEAPAEPQAEHFLSVVGDPTGLLLMVDYELYGEELPLSPSPDTLNAFVAALKERVGDHPILIYSGRGYWNMAPPNGDVTDEQLVTWDADYPWESSGFGGPELYSEIRGANWGADWAGVDPGWGERWGGQEPMFWQFSGNAKVAGVKPVDVNAFRGTEEEMLVLTGAKATRKKKRKEKADDGERGKKMVKAADLVAACKLLRGFFYRTWEYGGVPMWWGLDGYGWHAGEQPDLAYMETNGVMCSDMINWGLQYCGGDAIGGTGAMSDALLEWSDLDTSAPGEAGAVAVSPYRGPALADQGHVLLYTGANSTIQALYSDGVTEAYSDAETAGFLRLDYYGKLPGVDYSEDADDVGTDPSRYVKDPRWIAINADGVLVAEGPDYTRGWLDKDWRWRGPKEV